MDGFSAKELCNMTPHALHIRDASSTDGSRFVIVEPCGITPRMVSATQCPSEIIFRGRIQVFTPAEFTGVDFMDFETHVTKDTPIVVARYVAQYLKNIGFVWPGGIYSPDCGPNSAIRDDTGKLVGVQRLEGPWCRKM